MTSSDAPLTFGRVLKSIILSCIVLGVGAAVSYGLAQLRKEPEQRSPETRRYNVETFSATALDLQEIINAFGTAVAENEVVLSAQVSGEVREILPQLKIGLHVVSGSNSVSTDSEVETRKSDASSKGDLLLQIDPSTYEEKVAAAKHRLDEDQSELARIVQEKKNLERTHEKIEADIEDARQEFQKVDELRKKGISTDSDVRRAQMELRQHEKAKILNANERDLLPVRRDQVLRRIESHTAELNLSQLDLQRTFVRPPIDGILSAVQVQRGQYVKVGEPLLTVTSLNHVEIAVPVTLEDYAKILPNVLERQFPTVELAENETARPRWKGVVVRVAPKADEHTRTANVFVGVNNAEQATPLLPGTFVHARINGPILKHIVAVPKDAVLNGKAMIDLKGSVIQRPVTIRRHLNGLALIDSGVEIGDQVILTNLDVLFEGAQVVSTTERTIEEELDRPRTKSARLAAPMPQQVSK